RYDPGITSTVDFRPGYSRSICDATSCISACTCFAETLSCNRPTTLNQLRLGRDVKLLSDMTPSFAVNGSQTSGTVISVPRKSGAATPTTVKRWRFSTIEVPITLLSEPNLRCQKP